MNKEKLEPREVELADNENEEGNEAYDKVMKEYEISKEIKEGKLNKKHYHGEKAYEKYVQKTEHQLHTAKWTGYEEILVK